MLGVPKSLETLGPAPPPLGGSVTNTQKHATAPHVSSYQISSLLIKPFGRTAQVGISKIGGRWGTGVWVTH